MNTPKFSGVCNTGNALINLFEHCKAGLTVEQLLWLDNLTEHATEEAKGLAQSLTLLANTHFANADMLNGLADRASAIAALIHITDEAAYLANEKRREAGHEY